jgi:hypothetical protein
VTLAFAIINRLLACFFIGLNVAIRKQRIQIWNIQDFSELLAKSDIREELLLWIVSDMWAH